MGLGVWESSFISCVTCLFRMDGGSWGGGGLLVNLRGVSFGSWREVFFRSWRGGSSIPGGGVLLFLEGGGVLPFLEGGVFGAWVPGGRGGCWKGGVVGSSVPICIGCLIGVVVGSVVPITGTCCVSVSCVRCGGSCMVRHRHSCLLGGRLPCCCFLGTFGSASKAEGGQAFCIDWESQGSVIEISRFPSSKEEGCMVVICCSVWPDFGNTVCC